MAKRGFWLTQSIGILAEDRSGGSDITQAMVEAREPDEISDGDQTLRVEVSC